MLPARARLRRRRDFGVAMRGRRAGGPLLVVHVAHPDDVAAGTSPRVGFAVGRRVGIAVVRNRVRRRLQHLVAERLGTLPEGALIVVRAQPGAAGADYDRLGAELDRLLARALRPRPPEARPRPEAAGQRCAS